MKPPLGLNALNCCSSLRARERRRRCHRGHGEFDVGRFASHEVAQRAGKSTCV